MATGKDTDRLIPILRSSQQFVVKHWQTAISDRPATEPRSRYLVNPVDDKMRVVGWKILADGSNQGFTDRQREPRVFNLSPIGQSISGTFCGAAALAQRDRLTSLCPVGIGLLSRSHRTKVKGTILGQI